MVKDPVASLVAIQGPLPRGGGYKCSQCNGNEKKQELSLKSQGEDTV